MPLIDPVRLVRQDVLDKAREAREAAALEESANPPSMAADPSQIAPFGQPKPKTNAFKRKSKSYTKARDEGQRVRDPDRFPWVLTDFDESHAYTGALQGEASSNFALFVFSVGVSV
jgi:hypothetical protein